MDTDALYPVCPHRNVPAAFERFHGPDSGGVERFFIDDITRLRDLFDAMASTCERFEQRAAMCGSTLQALLLFIWVAACLYAARFARGVSDWAAHPQLRLLPGPRPIQTLRVLLVPSVAPLVQLYGVLARARSHWAENPQLPLLLAPQPVPAFPV